MSRTFVDPPPRRAASSRRRRRGGRGPLLGLVLALVLVLGAGGAVVGGASLLAGLTGGPPDYPGPGSGSVEVAVEPGDSASAIARTLADSDVVKSSEAFVQAAADDERSRGIKPGTYRMAQQMSADGALERMLDPESRVDSVVTLPEGLRLGAALETIAASTRLTLPQLEAAADTLTAELPRYGRGARSVEGFLFPSQYDLGPTQTAAEFLEDMLRRYERTTERLRLVERAREIGRDPYDVLIVASLVESEVPPADFGKAARVVYNRLDAGRKLQVDSTVNYALDRSTTTVTFADLEVDSPYNTYKHAGLPPTPINSPGELAIEAALSPADGDWFYWVTTDLGTGETKFAKTSEEFGRLKAELDQFRREQG